MVKVKLKHKMELYYMKVDSKIVNLMVMEYYTMSKNKNNNLIIFLLIMIYKIYNGKNMKDYLTTVKNKELDISILKMVLFF